jgi:protein-disulfide isomerase/uncharacterized membrane protein
VAIASLMGFGIAMYLGMQHDSNAPSACNIDSSFNCDVVNRSVYSEMMGYPIAFLGAAYYFSMLLISVMGIGDSKKYRLAGMVLTATGIGAVLFSVYLAYISKFVLGAWCLFCIGMYGINVILTVLGTRWTNQAQKEFEPSDNDSEFGTFIDAFVGGKDSTSGVFMMGFLTIAIAGLFMSGSKSEPTKTTEETVADLNIWHLIEPAGPVALDGTEPVYGNPDAKYTVVEFADFECPYCGMVAPELKKLVDDNPDVKMLFKHYPLSNICNDNVAREGHTNACAAAIAADCAGKQGKFWEFNATAFKNQKYLSRDDLLFLAERVKLNVSSFATCLEDSTMVDGVKSDISSADKAGLSGTPSLFLRGFEGSKWVKIDGTTAELQQTLIRLRKGDKVPSVLPKSEE